MLQPQRMELNIKVVLVGSEYSGKTTLIAKYISGVAPSRPPRTVAHERSAKIIITDKTKTCFDIIDTTGNFRLAELVLGACTNAHYVIVCYDLSKPDAWDTAKEWIRLIRSRIECQIVICGTKQDLLDAGNQRAVRETIINTYADGLQLNYFETSIKCEGSIDLMFQFIIQDYIKLTQTAFKVATLKREYGIPAGTSSAMGATDPNSDSKYSCRLCNLQ